MMDWWTQDKKLFNPSSKFCLSHRTICLLQKTKLVFSSYTQNSLHDFVFLMHKKVIMQKGKSIKLVCKIEID